MGACDAGRCCKGSVCTDDKKCCCSAGKKGTFHAGEVCRTAACQKGSDCSYTGVCDCEATGGTLVQTCDPCLFVTCNPLACETCVNGVCVSTCAACQDCQVVGLSATCVPKVCAVCEECQASVVLVNGSYRTVGTCVPTGTPCGMPIVACCGENECCVDGACVPCDCSDSVQPDACHICVNGEYVTTCQAGQVCCDGECQQCCDTGDCAAGYKCVAGTCEPKECSDYWREATVQCYDCSTNGLSNVPAGTLITAVPGVNVIGGNCYCGTSSSAYNLFIDTSPGGSGTCPAGCVSGPSNLSPDCTTLQCWTTYQFAQCQPNELP